MVVRRHRGSAAGSGASIPDTKESLILSPDGTPASARRDGGSGTAVMDSEPPVRTASSATNVDHKFFQRKVIEDLKGLGANKTEVEQAVRELTKLYSKDRGDAEAKFQKIHDSFVAARDADAILNEEEAKAEGLLKLADGIEGLNVAKARLLARMGSRIPGVKLLAGALESLATLELDIRGLEISDKGVFETLASFIRGTDSKLKERGIVVSGGRVMDALESVKGQAVEFIGNDRLDGIRNLLSNVTGAMGINLEKAATAATARLTGINSEDLSELGAMATGGGTPKGRGGRGGGRK
jgi:hypothetical protein